MSSRVYIGNLPSRATERDVEHFFRGFGRIREVMLKNGFGFVEFEDARDADDAVYDLNGRDLCGERVIVEISRSRDRGSGRNNNNGRTLRYPPPMQTRYRMLVTNLSTRFSWQDLKDMMRQAGEVTYADAHKRVRNEAIVCFATHDDLRRAMDKFQGKDINGRRIKLVDDTEGGSGGGDRRRGRSASRSRSRSRSRSARRSRTRSPPSRSRSGTPVKNGGGSDIGKGKKRSRSRSASSASSASSRKK